MPHPLHFHGQRFLVVRENGKTPLEGLAWRDSYLIGRGYTVDRDFADSVTDRKRLQNVPAEKIRTVKSTRWHTAPSLSG